MKKISVLFLFFLPLLMAEGWVQAQSVGLRIPDTTSVQGSVMDLPLYVDSTLTGKDVYSYSFQLSYDPYYLKPESVIVSGTISEAFGTPLLNTSVSGQVSIAAAGTAPLTGEGKLIIIRWVTKNSGWTSLGFTDLKHNYLNEGTPTLTLKPGNIYIEQAPFITVGPDTKVIAKGDQLQFNVWGGTSPYTWSVTNPALAEVDHAGLLTAKAPGMEKVIAVDIFGVRDTTNYIEIRSFRLSVPNDLTQWQGATLEIPVFATDLTGLDITSGTIGLTYDQNVLSPESIVQSGTLLESSQTFMKKAEGTVNIAFAGTSPLIGAGTLLYIRFRVLSANYGTDIRIDKALMNEKLMAACTNGYFSVKNFKYRYIYPSEGALVIGESVELNLYGEAIQPWTWSVNDTTVADINQSGVLTGKKHGQVIVTVIDSAGAPAYSDKFTIYDTRVTIPDTAICHYGSMVLYPLYLESLPHDSINSYQVQLTYNNTYLSFSGIETVGTGTQSWISSVNETDGKINLAASGAMSLNKSGQLLKLKFLPKAGFNNGSWAGIHIDDLIINEGSPYVLPERDGSIFGISGNTARAEIHPMPASVICAGDTMTFSVYVEHGGNSRFQWLKNGNPISGENAVLLHIASLADKDTISCRVISTEACVVDSLVYSNLVVVTVNSFPANPDKIIGDTTVVAGSSGIVYTVPPILNAISYIWCLSDGVTGSSTTNSIVLNFAPDITSALITVHGVNDCGPGKMNSLAVVSFYDGLNSMTNGKIQLYPNPVNDHLHIVINNGTALETRVEVYDAIGRMIKIGSNLKENGINLDFSRQGSGIYLLKLTLDKGTTLFKIIKK